MATSKLHIASFVALAGRLFGVGLRFFYVFFLARLLGARDMGLYTLSLSIVSIGAMIAGAGFGNPTIRLTARYRISGNAESLHGLLFMVCIWVLSLGLIIFFLIICGADVIARDIFGKPELHTPIVLISGSIITFSFFNVLNNVLRGIGQGNQAVFLENIFMPICGLLIFLLLFSLGHKVIGAALAYFLSTATGLIFSLFLVTRSVRIRFPKKLPPLKDIMHESSAFFVLNIMNNLQNWMGIYVVGILMATEDVAIFRVASSIALLVSLPLQAVNDMLPPTIVKYHARSEVSRLQEILKENCRWIMALSLPIFVIIILFPHHILSLLGKDFTGGYSALVVLSIGYLFDAFTGSVSLVLRMTENIKYIIRARIIVFILSIGLYYYLGKAYGILGAACVSAGVIIVMNVWNSVSVFKLFGIRSYSFNLKDLLLAITVATLIMFLIKVSLGNILIALLVFSVTYMLMTKKTIFKSIS